MRITVIVSDTEYAKIKKAAGLIPLSAYLKAAVLAQLPAYDPSVITKNFEEFSKKSRHVHKCKPARIKS